ncbi:hypothetical protein JI721_05230 [Alicyclobacillus cycloheptanicus]|uniref:Uncharacterized protein n=1 Tax=Alicyclobacillus cycloheptanicus TaxID=1457 RepID=A0ABT9XN74_9BACL|nr:hypothetical protein [Alicyclobacillus cycloheptanicus]MDQ0191585.1 hypothetical protein [Alicyclobacillus cycloheptanicus]WDM02218.1 hypothetical protein JI721_05230 [Alicyclobacillus cycloheptanicus]
MDARAEAFVRRVQQYVAEGITMGEVAAREGIAYASVLQRLRRCGFRYDRYTMDIVPLSQMPGQHIVEGNPLPARAVHVVESLRLVNSDPDEVARRFDFRDVEEMAGYLKLNGMVWSTDLNDYVPTKKFPHTEKSTGGTTEMFALIDALASFLIRPSTVKENGRDVMPAKRIHQLDKPATIPRYRTGARRLPKTLTMALNLQQLLGKVSRECNMKQSEVFEVAFIDFCIKYGYEEDVRNLLC